MNIALLGYGKMGKAIETLALQRGHTVVATIDNETEWSSKHELLRQADVAIEFSTPATAVGNIERCLAMGLPVVVGTTGWYDRLEAMTALCSERHGTLFVASNFSIGMNIMFEMNRRLAQLMNRYPDYAVSIEETHHIHKLDAPSGTAITLADDAAAQLGGKQGWQLAHLATHDPHSGTVTETAYEVDAHHIPIASIRRDEVPGTHTVTYDSAVDTLAISHCAKSRQGLAWGALLAAEYVQGKKGCFTMRDLLANND